MQVKTNQLNRCFTYRNPQPRSYQHTYIAFAMAEKFCLEKKKYTKNSTECYTDLRLPIS